MFPSFGPFKQRLGGPSADFFEKLKCIQNMWMSHSSDMFRPPDSSESSLSDLLVLVHQLVAELPW